MVKENIGNVGEMEKEGEGEEKGEGEGEGEGEKEVEKEGEEEVARKKARKKKQGSRVESWMLDHSFLSKSMGGEEKERDLYLRVVGGMIFGRMIGPILRSPSIVDSGVVLTKQMQKGFCFTLIWFGSF